MTGVIYIEGGIEMDELVDVMREILKELQEINTKLDDIKGIGSENSLADICDKLDEIKGTGLYDSISDVCEKLDSVESAISSVELAINMKD